MECGTGVEIGPTKAYLAVCEWLLNRSFELIRPDLANYTLALPVLMQGGMEKFRISEGLGCNLRPEERFPFFTKRVCRARIWNDRDGELFKRLQSKAADYMDDIAELCHARYRHEALTSSTFNAF